MKYLTSSKKRFNELKELLKSVNLDMSFADMGHPKADQAEILIIDKALETYDLNPQKVVVSYPFVITDLLNAISLTLVHSQLADFSKSLPMSVVNENFDLVRNIFLKLGTRRVEEIDGLYLESRYNYGAGGWIDTLQILNNEDTWLICLLSSTSYRLSAKFLEGIYQMNAYEKTFDEITTFLENTKKHGESYHIGICQFNELSKELLTFATDGIQIQNSASLPFSMISYGAGLLRKQEKIEDGDLTEFSYRAAKINFLHDVTVVNFFDKKPKMRLKLVS